MCLTGLYSWVAIALGDSDAAEDLTAAQDQCLGNLVDECNGLSGVANAVGCLVADEELESDLQDDASIDFSQALGGGHLLTNVMV